MSHKKIAKWYLIRNTETTSLCVNALLVNAWQWCIVIFGMTQWALPLCVLTRLDHSCICSMDSAARCFVLLCRKWADLYFRKLFRVYSPCFFYYFVVLIASFACSRELSLPAIIRFSPYQYGFAIRLFSPLTYSNWHKEVLVTAFNVNNRTHLVELEITIRVTAK